MTELAMPPVIGRDHSLKAIHALLNCLGSGSGGVLVITGEAGIGKTRLLTDVLDQARAREIRVVAGRAQDYDATVGYSTLRDLLASLGLETVPAPARQTLAALSAAFDDEKVDDDTASRQHAAYSLTTRLFRELCADSPCVILLDDAHLADEETLTALSLTLRHNAGQPLLMVCAVRQDQWVPGSSFAATVGRLVDAGQNGVLQLEPLDEGEVRAFLESVFGSTPDDALVSYVYHQGRGNPLFTRETLLALRDQRSVRQEHGKYYLAADPMLGPVTQRGALIHRVFQQDRNSREVARALAAFGRFHLAHLPLLAELTRLEASQVRTAFDRLTAAAIMTCSESGWYEFVHPLVAEVLYQDLGPAERRRLHQAIAKALESTAPGSVRPLDWARHFVESAAPGDRRAVAAAVDAATATRSTAPLVSARWYGSAVDLLPAGAGDRGELLARQAAAYWKGSRPEAAVEAGTRALRELPDGASFTRTLGTVVNALYSTGRFTEALTVVNDQIGRSDDPHPMLAQRGLLLAHLGRSDEAAEPIREAAQGLAASRPEYQIVACSHLGHAHNLIGDFRTVEELAAQLSTMATDETNGLRPSARLSALESASYLLSRGGVLGRARELLALADELAPDAGWQDIGGQTVCAMAMTQYLAGEWTDALDTIRSGAVRLDFAGLTTNLASMRMIEAEILLHRGLLAEAEQAVEATPVAAEWPTHSAHRDVMRARIDLARGRAEPAVRTLRRVSEIVETQRWNETAGSALEVLVSAHLSQGEDALAAEAADRLLAVAERGGQPKTQRAADLADALVHRRDELAAHTAERAMAEGLVFLEARARFALGDRDESQLVRAATLFDAIGATRWSRRAAAEARGRGVVLAGGQPPAKRDGLLTATEIELARMVRDGLSNREIAESLHYSRKTVEAYLSRVYRKTNCRSRVDLVVALERNPDLLAGGIPAGPPDDHR